MLYEDGLLVAESIADLVAFADKMGGLEKLAFKEPILDDKKKVLVQSGRALSPSVVNQLGAREKQLQLSLVLANTGELRTIVGQRLGNEIQKRLSSEASLTTSLLKQKNFDIFTVMRAALSNDSFFTIVCRMLNEEPAIFGHLIDVAMLAVGLYAEARLGQAQQGELSAIFQAGMLHDYELLTSSLWQDRDSFPAEDEHDRRSYALLAPKNLPQGVAEMIKTSNQLEAKFTHTKDAKINDRWYNNTVELGGAVINLCEFFFTALREYNTKDTGHENEGKSEMQEILYLLAYQASMGFFPRPLVFIFERHFEKYAKIFAYADTIAKLEKSCKYQILALAYPKPRSVQVICRDQNPPCPLRISTSPLNIIQNLNKSVTRTGKVLKPGWYFKCKLSDELPYPPFDL